jgi:hypothetical protein
MKQFITNSTSSLTKWISTFTRIVKFFIFSGLVGLSKFLILQLLEKSNLLMALKINMDVFDIFHYWVAYWAFYTILFLSLPGLSALVLLRYLLGQKGVSLNIKAHLRLSMITVFLLVILVIMFAFTSK